MYNTIINPHTGRSVNVNGKQGKYILSKYVHESRAQHNQNGGGWFWGDSDESKAPEGGDTDLSEDKPSKTEELMMKVKANIATINSKIERWGTMKSLSRIVIDGSIKLAVRHIDNLTTIITKLEGRDKLLEAGENDKSNINNESEKCEANIEVIQNRHSAELAKYEANIETLKKRHSAELRKATDLCGSIKGILDHTVAADEEYYDESADKIETLEAKIDKIMNAAEDIDQRIGADESSAELINAEVTGIPSGEEESNFRGSRPGRGMGRRSNLRGSPSSLMANADLVAGGGSKKNSTKRT